MQHLQKTGVRSPRAISSFKPPPICVRSSKFLIRNPLLPLLRKHRVWMYSSHLERAVSRLTVLIALPHYLVTSLLHNLAVPPDHCSTVPAVLASLRTYPYNERAVGSQIRAARVTCPTSLPSRVRAYPSGRRLQEQSSYTALGG